MLDDLKERVEAIRADRKMNGIKQVWVTSSCLERLRDCVDYLTLGKNVLGVKPRMSEVIQLAVEDFMAENGILTHEELNEVVDNAFSKLERSREVDK